MDQPGGVSVDSRSRRRLSARFGSRLANSKVSLPVGGRARQNVNAKFHVAWSRWWLGESKSEVAGDRCEFPTGIATHCG